MSESKKDRAMKEDYLWDGSGEPDPEVQKLENLLGRYRHDLPAPAFDQVVVDEPARHRWRFPAVRFWVLWAAAAAILLMGVTTFVVFRARWSHDSGPAWEIARIEGAPRVGRRALSANSTTKLKVGQTLVTDNLSRASITLDETGSIDIDPDSRLKVLASGRDRKRLSLERGTIHATIWGPAGSFGVDTPSAIAVDLGCVFTLHVDDSGAGLVRTTMGWVGFKWNGHESFIPAGAVCATRPKVGPGTPYFEDASASFRDALTKFDFAKVTPQERNALLGILLSDTRKDDSLTLWHLLSRVSDAERPALYDRLAVLAPPPADVTREGTLRLDQKMLDSWWNSLGYGDVYLWHMYERTWSGR
jgi:FecR protein